MALACAALLSFTSRAATAFSARSSPSSSITTCWYSCAAPPADWRASATFFINTGKCVNSQPCALNIVSEYSLTSSTNEISNGKSKRGCHSMVQKCLVAAREAESWRVPRRSPAEISPGRMWQCKQAIYVAVYVRGSREHRGSAIRLSMIRRHISGQSIMRIGWWRDHLTGY